MNRAIISMKKVTWEEAYIQAALEVDKVKMIERVSAAREAILRQLQDIQQSEEHRLERKRMEIALRNLDALERESQNW
jgi:hypothetical protein